MRIIIIGEFSSFSKNLSEGLRAIGHECFVFSWGDSFKKIEQDNGYTVFSPQKPRHFYSIIRLKNRVDYYLYRYRLLNKIKEMSKGEKWDVVLVLNPAFIKKKTFDNLFSKEMILRLVNNPTAIFLSACGSDIPYYNFWDKQVWKNKELIELNKKEKGVLSASEFKHHEYCSSFINKVIPIMYDYAEAWRHSEYARSFIICPTIPLPVNTQRIKYNNEIKGKIVIFHGIIRPKAKGTHYIVSAMEKLERMYPDRVECYAEGGLPLDEYLKLLNRANILIDQVYAGSSGMNAIYALAMGKVLLGGNEPENSREYKIQHIPIINIGPDSDQIFKELEKLILNPEKIKRLSKECREYAEKYHDAKIIAGRYIDVFNTSLNNNMCF